jgi:hypothetical protein
LVKNALKTENMRKAAMKKKIREQQKVRYFIQKRNMTRGTSHCES